MNRIEAEEKVKKGEFVKHYFYKCLNSNCDDKVKGIVWDFQICDSCKKPMTRCARAIMGILFKPKSRFEPNIVYLGSKCLSFFVTKPVHYFEEWFQRIKRGKD